MDRSFSLFKYSSHSGVISHLVFEYIELKSGFPSKGNHLEINKRVRVKDMIVVSFVFLKDSNHTGNPCLSSLIQGSSLANS